MYCDLRIVHYVLLHLPLFQYKLLGYTTTAIRLTDCHLSINQMVRLTECLVFESPLHSRDLNTRYLKFVHVMVQFQMF